MLEHRPYDSLGANSAPGVKAKLHFGIFGLGRPDHKPLGDLIVWNDDEFGPGRGFGLHPHSNVEIISYVRQGAITHGDSLGNSGRTEAGDVQVMSAGTGVRHSEFNYEDEPTRLFQIWLKPNQFDGPPAWANRAFPKADRAGSFVVLASGYEEDTDALSLRANARVVGASATAGQTLSYSLSPGRKAYLVLASGSARVNGLAAAAGDGFAVQDERSITVQADEDTEIVLVDVA